MNAWFIDQTTIPENKVYACVYKIKFLKFWLMQKKNKYNNLQLMTQMFACPVG